MAASTSFIGLPRSVRVVALPLAFLILTAAFVFFTFPYERLRDPLADRLYHRVLAKSGGIVWPRFPPTA